MGGGRAQARWCVLGLICWEWGGGRGHRGPFSQRLLCLPWQLGLRNQPSAFLPHQGPPIHKGRNPTSWDPPSPPTLARSKPRPGMPQVRPSRGHRAAVLGGGAGAGTTGPLASGLWLMGQSSVWGGISRMESGHIRGSSCRGSGHCTGAWGAPSLPAWRCLVLASLPWGPGPSAPAFWAVWPQPRPPCGCVQASAAPGAQTPRAISAPELLIFLKRLAALTAMKFFFQRLFMRYFLSRIWDLRRRLQRLAFSARLLSQG